MTPTTIESVYNQALERRMELRQAQNKILSENGTFDADTLEGMPMLEYDNLRDAILYLNTRIEEIEYATQSLVKWMDIPTYFEQSAIL